MKKRQLVRNRLSKRSAQTDSRRNDPEDAGPTRVTTLEVSPKSSRYFPHMPKVAYETCTENKSFFSFLLNNCTALSRYQTYVETAASNPQLVEVPLGTRGRYIVVYFISFSGIPFNPRVQKRKKERWPRNLCLISYLPKISHETRPPRLSSVLELKRVFLRAEVRSPL